MKRIRRKRTGLELLEELSFLTPALFLLILFIIVPFTMSLPLSLTNQRLIPGPIPTKFILFRNYQRIFSDPDFWQVLKNNAYFTILVLPVQCGFALLTAIFLNRSKRLKNFLRGLFFLPFITPMVIVTVIWSTIFQFPTGVLNSFLGFISAGIIEPINWLGNSATAMPSIVVLSAWQAYGFQMVIYLAGLQSIPDDFYEAADIFGATGLQKFWYVTLPSLRNTHVLVFTITTIQALKLFTQINIMTNGGPLGATNVIVHYIYEAGFIAQKIGYSSAGSIIMFCLVVVVVLVQRYLFRLDKDKNTV